MGGFATSLLSVSLAMMGFRGVTTQTVFVGDLCFVACVALLTSAQWEMVKGNTFSYTVLSAFGELRFLYIYIYFFPPLRCGFANTPLLALFYGGYGATLIPGLGIVEAYGGLTSEYYNAVGFFILSKNPHRWHLLSTACLRN